MLIRYPVERMNNNYSYLVMVFLSAVYINLPLHIYHLLRIRKALSPQTLYSNSSTIAVTAQATRACQIFPQIVFYHKISYCRICFKNCTKYDKIVTSWHICSTLLVLNGTSLNNNALLALNRYHHLLRDCYAIKSLRGFCECTQ